MGSPSFKPPFADWPRATGNRRRCALIPLWFRHGSGRRRTGPPIPYGLRGLLGFCVRRRPATRTCIRDTLRRGSQTRWASCVR